MKIIIVFGLFLCVLCISALPSLPAAPEEVAEKQVNEDTKITGELEDLVPDEHRWYGGRRWGGGYGYRGYGGGYGYRGYGWGHRRHHGWGGGWGWGWGR